MSGYVRWDDLRAQAVERVGGEAAFEERQRHFIAEVQGTRLSEIRRGRGLTQQDLADRTGATVQRIRQIEQGDVEQRSLDQYVAALGGTLRTAIHFDDGDVAVLPPLK
jgi:DNA-binding XRE family transcriptional regulator